MVITIIHIIILITTLVIKLVKMTLEKSNNNVFAPPLPAVKKEKRTLSMVLSFMFSFLITVSIILRASRDEHPGQMPVLIMATPPDLFAKA